MFLSGHKNICIVLDCLLKPALSFLLLYRRIRFGFPFRKIPLTKGKFAFVDPADYRSIKKFKWSVIEKSHIFYAVRYHRKNEIRMHRQITNAPPHFVVDHIDHNGLNNTRKNLRLCTRAQNSLNQKIRKGCSSKYKGVYWHKRDKKFYARISHKGKSYHLGCFNNEILAACSYDKKAKELFGEFAFINFPQSFLSEVEGLKTKDSKLKTNLFAHPELAEGFRPNRGRPPFFQLTKKKKDNTTIKKMKNE